MEYPVFEDITAEVARDLELSEDSLRTVFLRYYLVDPKHSGISDQYRAACYAIYRLTKLRWSFLTTAKSRAEWREVALSLGANKVLAENRKEEIELDN